MTQSDRIFAVIESKGWISNADFQEMGLVHIGRNRLTEEKGRAHFGKIGKFVFFVKGKDFLSNRWELRDIPKDSEGQTIKAACHKCGNVFEARLSNVKAGFGRFCSRRCASSIGGKRRGELASLARAQIGVQAALL
jgi:hypothetical protein